MSKPNKALTLTILLILGPQIMSADWTKVYGGGDMEEGTSVRQTTDGGYIVVSYTFSFGAGDGDIWLLKMDSAGDTLWTKTYGSVGWDGGTESPFLDITSDGGYVITGMTENLGDHHYDLWLIKTDDEGNEEWARTYGGSDLEEGRCVHQTSDSGYVVCGYTFSYGAGETDIWLLKTDEDGDTQWTITYGGENQDYGWAIQETPDKGFIVAGTYRTDYSILWILRTDEKGDTVWSRLYSEEGTGTGGHDIEPTDDGNYIVAAGKGDSIWLLKINPSGDTIWTRTYIGGENARGYEVKQTPDEGYVIAGAYDFTWPGGGDVWVLRTDSNGDTLWTRIWGTPGASMEWASSVDVTSDGDFVITGITGRAGGEDGDLFLMKIDDNAAISEQPPEGSLTFEILTSVGPRVLCSFSPSAKRSQVSVFDASGRKVDELDVPKAGGVVSWGEEHNPGVYFIVADINGNRQTEKVILVR